LWRFTATAPRDALLGERARWSLRSLHDRKNWADFKALNLTASPYIRADAWEAGMQSARGVYWDEFRDTGGSCVLVRYGESAEVELPESLYRRREYEPDFDTLPWKGDVEAIEVDWR